nr:MAG TPA: hypothetical protein [Bacteriophage sp.]
MFCPTFLFVELDRVGQPEIFVKRRSGINARRFYVVAGEDK